MRILIMEDVEFHFALESIFGKGRKFLLDRIKEAKIFREAEITDSTKPLDQICIN